MASYNGNVAYCAIDGVTLAAQFVNVNLESSIEEVDVTAGAGAEDVQRDEGLRSDKVTIKIAYDVDAIQSHVQKLKPGKHLIDIGPQGNSAGKPRHYQEFLVSSAKPFEVGVKKPAVVIEMSGNSARRPIYDFFNGDTY